MDAKALKVLLNKGFFVDERNSKGETALCKAVFLGDFECVRVLLEYGADVKVVPDIGLPPIYLYNEVGKDLNQMVKILEILLKHGALSTPAVGGIPPAEYILHYGCLRAIKVLMQYDSEWKWDPYSSLVALLRNSKPNVLRTVRGKQMDVNAVMSQTSLPLLSYAALYGKYSKVKFLLESGANPNAGEDEQRPLICAIKYKFAIGTQRLTKKNHLLLIQILLQYGADIQYCFKDARTVFDVASNCDLLKPVIAHLAMIESLSVTIRCRINSQDNYKIQYENCKRHLEEMNTIMMCKKVSLYMLLTENQWKITNYARNHELVTNFESLSEIYPSLDSYYLFILRKRLGKAIHVAKLRKEAVVPLSKILNRHNNNIDISNEILDYIFSGDDLKNICKVHDFQE